MATVRLALVCGFFFSSIAVFPTLAHGQADWLPEFAGPSLRSVAPPPPVAGGAEGETFYPPYSDFGSELLGVSPTSTVIADHVFGLTAPANPNLLFGNDANPLLGTAVRVPYGIRGGLPLVYGGASVAAQLAVGSDSGFVGGGLRLNPSTIALNSTDEARRRQQAFFSSEGTQLAVTLAPAVEEKANARADFQLDFFDGVQLRLATGQVAVGSGVLYGGKTWTTFMDEYAVPTSIAADTTAAGTVFRRLAQLGYSFPIHHNNNFRGFIAIEEPTTSDYTVFTSRLPTRSDVALQRYPTLVGRLHWVDCRDWRHNSSLHLAGMLRGMGREDDRANEDFEPGWGLTFMAKFRPTESGKNTFYAGVVAGKGIGNYIFGFSHPGSVTPNDNKPAASLSRGQLSAQKNLGAHFGFTRTWDESTSTNFGYGYAYTESTAAMPTSAARRLQNSWINHQVKLNDLVAAGLEYHYAIRDVRSSVRGQHGKTGDNHRVLFVVQFLSKSK